jgi:PAS domain S-box-containing protein
MTGLAPKTILLVEDDAVIALSERRSLEGRGYRVMVAGTGEEAVEAARTARDLDLILMDIDLGAGMDGPEAAELILRERDMPVVFLSSHVEPDIVERTERITSYGYVVKNSGITVLDASIKMAFKLFEANRKTREANSRLKATLDALPDLLFEVGRDGQYHAIHYRDSSQLVDRAEALVGKRIGDLLPPDVTAIVMSAIGEADRRGISIGKTYELDLPVGRRLFEIHAARMEGLGSERRFVLLCRDITERHRVEEALERSELKYRMLFERSPLGLISFDSGGVITACNGAFSRIVGSPKDSLVGLNMLGLPDPGVLKALGRALEGKVGVYEGDYRSVTSGKLTPVRVMFAPMAEGGLGIPGGLGIVEDISERRVLEAELARATELVDTSSNNFSLLAENLPVYISYFNAETTRYEYVNRAFASFFGRTPQDIIGRLLKEVIGEANFEFALPYIESARAGQSTSYENYFRLATGKRWVRVTYVPVKDRSGRVVSILVFSTDITEHKEAEESIRSLLEEKDLLLKEVHHRLKNNMSTVKAMLDLQASSLGDRVAAAALEDAGNRLRGMMLLYEKLYQSGGFAEVSLGDYLGALADEALANSPGDVELRVEKDMADFVLDARKAQPTGIIVNELLSNCVKHAFRGRTSGCIRVAASLEGRTVHIRVEDDGVGLPGEGEPSGPAGFGLSLVEALVGQLRGRLTVERGEGTAFALDFEA